MNESEKNPLTHTTNDLIYIFSRVRISLKV